MWLEDGLSESEALFKRVEISTTQSCEKRHSEMHCKNISRKFICFDLSDKQQMVEVGKLITPFGFWQHMQNVCIHSKISFLRIWAETGMAKRGEQHLRALYLRHSEKFFDVEFENSTKVKMRLKKCNYIISEVSSQKKIFIKNEDEKIGDDEDFKLRLKNEELKMLEQESYIRDFSREERQKQHLIGPASEKA
jgi:hypothetical protein